MTQSIYERIGGHEAIFATVDTFYAKVMADPTLQPFFAHMSMPAQIDKQVAFLTMAFGGPSKYTGRDLRTAHAGLLTRGLGEAHFDRVANYLRDTLQDLEVPAPLIEEVMVLVATTKNDVLSR